MISAFGIVHKSQIAPGVFKPITELRKPVLGIGGAEFKNFRAEVQGRARLNQLGTRPPQGTIRNPNNAAGRKIWGSRRSVTPAGKQIQNEPMEPQFRGGSVAYAQAQPNGRGGGIMRLTEHAHEHPEVITHEQAHLDPHRNIYGFQQRMKDPFRHGREEGRADFTAGMNDYPGRGQFRRGYRDVQRRMAVAQQRRKS